MDKLRDRALDRVVGARFLIEEVIKQQGRRRTLGAQDLLTGAPVVLKMIDEHDLTPLADALLEHEIAVLAELDSPHMAKLVASGTHEGARYVAMARLPGRTLAERLAHGPMSARQGIATGLDLAGALVAAHGHQILHRDVKPSNIIIRVGAGGRFEAALIDFGFSWSTRLGLTTNELALGTVRYLSPEAAGTVDAIVDERADLYSLGVVLFEAIVGAPPYDAPSATEVLRQHLASPIPSLRSHGVAVPRALDEVVQRLLAKDPHERYQTAEAVVGDLEKIAKHLDAGVAEPPVIVGAQERRRHLAQPSFVGRAAELERLHGELQNVDGGAASLVLLEAASGGGKTRLLAEFGRAAAQRGCWLLHGQGLDQAAPRPFQVLSGVASALLEACANDQTLLQWVLDSVGDDAQAIVDALPSLADLFGVRATIGGTGDHGEARSVRALGVLFDALAGVTEPTLILLDDCQWADELTVRALTAWLDRGQNRRDGLMIVAAFRSEEVAADHPLRNVSPDVHLVLAALGEPDLRALLGSMAGHLPAPAIDTAIPLSEGSPFMAAAVLRGMVETGGLFDAGQGWKIDEGRLAELGSSRHAAAFLSRRIGLLDAESQRLLHVGAVLGKEFDVAMLAKLAGRSLAETIRDLEQPKRRHMVWLDHDVATVAFTHDKLREAVLASLPAADREELHREAALQLEALDKSRVFELAYHFDAASLPRRALPYAIEAAEQARSQHSLRVAHDQYWIARRGVEEGDAPRVRAIAEGLGEVAMLRGDYETAATEFETARSLAATPSAVAEIDGRLGELAFKRGDSEGAARQIEAGLRSLGRRVPASMFGFTIRLLRELLVQTLHTLVPRLVIARRSSDDPRAHEDLLAARLLSRLAHAYWFTRGSIPTAWAHLRELNIAERYPPSPELAQAYSEQAPVMTLITWFSRGIKYVERSLELRRASGDVWAQGQSLHFYGLLLYGASRYEESILRCREAIRLLERTGDQWEVNTARWHIAYAMYRLGDLQGAITVAKQVHASGVEIGDGQARGISLAVWSKASGGEVPLDLLSAELALVGGDLHTGAEVLQAEAIRLIRAGHPAEAATVLRRARGMVLRALAMQEYVAPLFAWLATAMRQVVESAPAFAPRRRRQHLRRARRAARHARVVSRMYRNNLPHALRESALIDACGGRSRKARRRFKKADAIARQLGADAELLATLEAWVRVGQSTGWDVAVQAAEAKTLRVALGEDRPGYGASRVQVTASLVDRFDTVLAAGRRIAASLTVDDVHAAVHDAALTTLRGDRCLVVDLTGPEPGVVHGDASTPFSGTAVRRAAARGRPEVFGGFSGSGATTSVLLENVRSGLCIPLRVRGHAQACVLVTSQQVAGLYGPDEVRLAEFIGAIAGAALENAEGFAEVHALTAKLTSEVARQTAGLKKAANAERVAREESDHRAGLLRELAAAGRRMSALDPGDVLTAVVETTQALGFEAAEICMLSDDGTTYVVTHQRGLPTSYHDQVHPSTLGMVGMVLEAGESVVVEDYTELPDALAVIVSEGFKASIAAPITANGRDLGVLVAGNRSRRRLGQEEIEVFDLLAAQAGRAVENARAYADQVDAATRLADLDRMKDDFLASASHELRTPLAVILGMGRTLEDHWSAMQENGMALQFVGRVNANADALMEIITSLLDFSRLQRGSLVVQPVSIELSTMLLGIADRLGPLLEDHDFQIDVEPDLHVEADAVLLGRAVENLLTNGVRYTPPGTPIRLMASRCDGLIEVAVQDEGPGIPDDEIGRVAERFYRGSGASVGSKRGLGLGLAFTSDILELHGSRLEIENVPGSGFRACFRLDGH